ncbi:VirB3 family type IV secretion system protein [Xanthomonas campestris pv. campestris]|uniref:conjugal transfer protein TrbD n=1 Tax=Xanthomonas campestris TaxID=339 RepID=UPI0031BEEE50|nr:VirB3 family type IV secretion system protein [Xanthomonas campestris pv. campestris]
MGAGESDRAPRRVRIYRALNRPNLFMGGERKLVQSLLGFSGVVLVSNPVSIGTWLVVGLVYSCGLYGLRRLAKKDPMFSRIYQRQLKLQPYYPPRRGLDAKRPVRTLG